MSWFYNLKIRQKLLLTIGVIMTIFIAVNFFLFIKMDNIRKSNKIIASIWLPSVYHISDLKVHCSDFRIKEYKHILAKKKEDMIDIEREMAVTYSDFKEDRDAYEKLIKSPKELELYNSFKESFSNYLALHDSILKYSRVNDDEKAAEIILHKSKEQYDDFTRKLDTLIFYNMNYTEKSSFQADFVFSNTLKLVILISIISLILVLLFSLWIAKQISDPIKKLEMAASNVSKGKIQTLVEMKSKDEVGSLSLSFNKMAGNIENTLDELSNFNLTLEQRIKERTFELEEINKEYQQEINERKKAEQQINKYVNELREANATKDKFFSIVAHDLKSPFSNLLGLSEIILENIELYDKAKIEEIVKLMYQSASNSYKLLENLLEWAMTRSGKIKWVPGNLNLNLYIDENIELFSSVADNKQISFQKEMQGDTYVYADKNMVNTIIRNLITNAIKFSFNDGKIFIKSFENGNYIQVDISDNGIGMEKNSLNNLFKIDTSFTTLGTAKEKGTGLGLLLCKEFVDINGGKIWVESEPGKGSKFSFTLPKRQQ